MAGCTDLSFRLIARENGAKFCFFEMIDSNSLIHSPNKDPDIINTTEEDLPIAGQLIGSDPDVMLKAAKILVEKLKLSFMDINAACPVNKMTKKKSGAHLIREPKLLYKIIKKLSSNLSLPITVKIRIGYESVDLKEIATIAKNCQKNGASALFVHGRTRAQGYSGEIDYNAIKVIKESVTIPVFGSGNILSPENAKSMLNKTGCDGILVARGALGRPWIFKSIDAYLKTGAVILEPNIETKKLTLKKHLYYIDKYKKKTFCKIGFMRKMAIWYMKSFPHAARIRGEINNAQSMEELFSIVDSAKDLSPVI
ncbi:tRNA dihydrouridine synthase DusB [Candidatus Saganbacteria bacterium]|nr:tRNA dihydrouridine synthase DusB [Candidatus Saganbacteria bacterium]